MIYETVGTFCLSVGRSVAVGVTAKVGEKEETKLRITVKREWRAAGWTMDGRDGLSH